MSTPESRPMAICPYPFSRIELGTDSFVPCCNMWLTDEYHQMEQGEDLWNGPAAQELRRRMYEGDFSLCRRDLCKTKLINPIENKSHILGHTEAKISDENLQAIANKETFLPGGPVSISTIADPRCNLACPSCRKDFIFTLDDNSKSAVEQSKRHIWDYREQIEIIRMSGNGEVFFSPWLRSLFKLLSKENFPRLQKVNIQTNGVLMSPEEVEKLRPGTDFIHEVMVSIDAGTEEVYTKVRRGGDWKRLMKNLEWISREVENKRFGKLKLQFVVRKENYKTMQKFVELGHRLKADVIFFSAFMPWENIAITDYHSEAIHLPQHDEHNEFLHHYQEVKAQPRVAIFDV